MNYNTFKEAYDMLSPEYQSIIFTFLQRMEHAKDNPNDKIDYSRGLKIAMKDNDLSLNSLVSILEKKWGVKELQPTITSMLARGSSSSTYFQDTLNILNIDETFLIQNSEYFQSRIDDIKWCFESISAQNQEAVFYLTVALTRAKRTMNVSELFHSSNIGVNSNEDIPIF